MKRKEIDQATIEALQKAVATNWSGLANWMRENKTPYSRYVLARELKNRIGSDLESLRPVRGKHVRSIYRARKVDGSRATAEETEAARKLLIAMAVAGIARHALGERLKNETGLLFSRGRIESVIHKSRIAGEKVDFYQPLVVKKK